MVERKNEVWRLRSVKELLLRPYHPTVKDREQRESRTILRFIHIPKPEGLRAVWHELATMSQPRPDVGHLRIDPNQFWHNLDQSDIRDRGPKFGGDSPHHLIVKRRSTDLSAFYHIIVSVVTAYVNGSAG